MAKAKRSFKKDINQRVLIVSTFSLFLFDRLFVHIVYLSPLREKNNNEIGDFFQFFLRVPIIATEKLLSL